MNINDLKEKMEKTIDNMTSQLRCMKYGHINSGLIDTIKINYYGQQTPINKIAQTNDVVNGISIQPFNKELCGPIITSLKHAGFDAYLFSKTMVMVNKPKPSGEDKIKVRQQISKLGEEAKISIRQIRHSVRKNINSESENDIKNYEKLIQHYTDGACKMIDKIIEEKCKKL